MPPSFFILNIFFLFLNVRVKFACEFDPEKNKTGRERVGRQWVGLISNGAP
jgi:hypothetical protein